MSQGQICGKGRKERGGWGPGVAWPGDPRRAFGARFSRVPSPLDVSPFFLLVLPEGLINFHKQIPPQEQIPTQVYLGRVTLATLCPGLGTLARVGNGAAQRVPRQRDPGTSATCMT